MKGGILEVLLVSAEGLGHTNIIGKPKYFVTLQCGNQVYKSKTSRGNPEEICWNEKFTFELPNFTEDYQMYLKLTLMDEEYFTDGGFVGETIIYLKGLITEGRDKGSIRVTPAPYNVVLDDDTYRGQISIALKYVSEGVFEPDRKEEDGHQNHESEVDHDQDHSVCKALVNLWKIPLRKFCYSQNIRNSIAKDSPS